MVALTNISNAELESDYALINRLRNALDTGSLLTVLRHEWSYLANSKTKLCSCEVERVHTRRNQGFVIEYLMGFEGPAGSSIQRVFGQVPRHNPRDVFGETIVSLQSRKRRQLSKKYATNRVALIPALGLILRFPGFDEKIDGLRLLRDPNWIVTNLSGATKPFPDHFARSELLAHRLGKRSVVRLLSDTQEGDAPNAVIVKLYKRHSQRSANVAALMRTLSDSNFGGQNDIRLPAIIHEFPMLPATVMENLSGTPLSELCDRDVASGMALAGRALGTLHDSQIETNERFGPDDEVALLCERVGLAAEVMPECAPLLYKALGNSQRLIENCRSFEATLIHRDFHEKQILVDGKCAALIDLDTSCMGDPAQDIGNFLAHLKFRELQTSSDVSSHTDAFLDGYRDVRSLPAQARVQAHTKSTLLRMACIYAFSSKWHHLLPRLIDHV